MSCAPFDLRDLVLGELSGAELAAAERHVSGCHECATELDQLRLTRAALMTLVEEEIPQRIGFVSDKVFEPSSARRWWAGFWGSASRLGFVSAAMLSAALLTSAFHRPVTVVEKRIETPVVAQAQPDVRKQVDEAVRKAVAETAARQEQKTRELLAASEQRHEVMMRRVADYVDEIQKRSTYAKAQSVNWGASQ